MAGDNPAPFMNESLNRSQSNRIESSLSFPVFCQVPVFDKPTYVIPDGSFVSGNSSGSHRKSQAALERKEGAERPESNSSISRSESLAPSMRVDDPTDSIVATLRKVFKRSGLRNRRCFQLPLNSSSSAIRRSIALVTLTSF